MTKKSRFITREYNREDDGDLYIAIASTARTPLGRLLAAGAYLPVARSEHGSFNSLAGLIRYITGDRRDCVRTFAGAEFDDNLMDQIPDSYEDVLGQHISRAISNNDEIVVRMIEHTAKSYPTLNWNAPFMVCCKTDDGLVAVNAPLWYREAIVAVGAVIQNKRNALGFSTPPAEDESSVSLVPPEQE